MSILTEINRIKDAVTAIVNAIKGKGVTVPTTAKVDDLASLVSAIPTGTDTSDATATASHILKGKTAYVKGEKVTGNIATYDGSLCQSRFERETATEYVFNAYMGGKRFVDNAGVNLGVEKSDFGDSYPHCVAEGYTFTSEHGFCIEGTLPIYDGTDMEAYVYDNDDECVYIEAPVSQSMIEDFFYSKVPLAVFGDVSPDKVLAGENFTSDAGFWVEGTMPSYGGGDVDGVVSYSDNGYIHIETPMEGKYVSDGVWTKIPLDTFGNTQANYVAEGHTFTSKWGFNIEGTLPIYDYSNIEAFYEPTCDTDDDFAFLGYTEQSIVEDEVYLGVPKSNFGNATASDVRKGKTFTSADGVCITGTYEDAVISVSLPTYRVTIWDNDGADVTATVMVNDGGVLKPQSTTIPTGGSIDVIATWNTPIFITSKYGVSSIQVYNFDDDTVNCPVYYDSNNNTHAVSIPYDNGNKYTIYAFM